MLDKRTELTSSWSSKIFCNCTRFSSLIADFDSKIADVGANVPFSNFFSKILYPSREGMSSGNDFNVLYSKLIPNTFALKSSNSIMMDTTEIIGFVDTNFPILCHKDEERICSSPTRGIFGQNERRPNNVNNAGIKVIAEIITTIIAIVNIGAKLR